MKNRFMALLLALMAGFAMAADVRPPRIDFTSRPEGANVIVDGNLRGVTPLTLYDLTPGRHHAHFELANYEAKDEFFPLEEGAYVSKHVELVPVKGLLLLTTEPAGCTVMYDGLSLGETPRLITSLDAKGSYRLQLQKAGYQNRTVDVKFNGRTPVVKHENLILDSGVLTVSTEPAGALVTVNGISRGETPLTVSDIPKGRAVVKIVKDGYKDVERELTLNAGDRQTLNVTLDGIPGGLRLTSVPEGARFYINGSVQGKAPIELNNVKPGTYTIRAELEGCGNVEKSVTVGNGRIVREEFRLESVLGRLEIRTQPAGAQVFVDGRLAGTTRSDNPSATVSDVLTVKDLREGEHTVLLKMRGYGEVVKHPTVESQRATPLDVRLKRVFTPNIRIETLTGTYSGVLVNNGPEAVVIEVSMGVNRSFPRVDIRKIELLEGNE